MRFKTDENLPGLIEAHLRARGHDVESAVAEGLQGAHDLAVLDACRHEGRALITLDIDFANIVAYPPAQARGIIVLRPGRQGASHLIPLLERVVLPRLGVDELDGRLWIASDSALRTHG